MKATSPLSRRHFLSRTALTASAIAVWKTSELAGRAAAQPIPPVAEFSKVYQELNLDFEETAEVTAAAGLDGIDCPVRPGGQILPERAADELPRLAETLRRRNLKVLLLTTGILGADSPYAEPILRTAKKLGIKYYRLGYWKYKGTSSPAAQLNNIKAQLKDLAALNKELGLCAIHQNHAGVNQVGAKVGDLYEIARAFDPEQIAIAFDLSHALNELGEGWREQFDKLQSHFRITYVKDWKRGPGFVPFGEGDLGASGFFALVKKAGYRVPLSMHTEYDWDNKGKNRTKAALIANLKRDLRVLKQWWETA